MHHWHWSRTHTHTLTHTLAQTCLIELWCRMRQTRKTHSNSSWPEGMERIDNRSWPSTSTFQINTEKVVETTIAKASEVEPQSWVAPEENRNKKELKLQNRSTRNSTLKLFCRYITKRPWWYPRIIWGASLDAASCVLSIPLQQKSWRYKFYIYWDVSHTHTQQQRFFFLRLRLFKAPTSEMKVKIKGMGMRWQTTSPGDETENAKEERKRGNTSTKIAQSWQTLKRAREKKKQTDDGPNTDQRRGRRSEAPDTTYTARAKPIYLGTR